MLRVGMGRSPLGQCQVPLGILTLKPDSSELLPGVCAVMGQNWDEAQREGSKWTELIWKCHVRRTSSGQIVVQPGCHLGSDPIKRPVGTWRSWSGLR